MPRGTAKCVELLERLKQDASPNVMVLIQNHDSDSDFSRLFVFSSISERRSAAFGRVGWPA